MDLPLEKELISCILVLLLQVLEEKEERAQQGTLLGTSHTYVFDLMDEISFLCQHFLLLYFDVLHLNKNLKVSSSDLLWIWRCRYVLPSGEKAAAKKVHLVLFVMTC